MLLALAVFLFGLDDLSVWALSLIKNARPLQIRVEEWPQIENRCEKSIAVLIANWKEHEVLENMIRGNRARIQYRNYVFFLGVYPNDEDTWSVARRLSAEFSNVEVLVNSLNGPTTKGQLLNEMVRQILESEKIRLNRFDLFLIHDAEDVIHPRSFKLINHRSDKYDFLQIPVFSLPTPRRKPIAGTYIDEFAEAHTNELVLRSRLRAPIPSAGVGTALSRTLVRALKSHRGGNFLSSACLTEDYELGYTAQSIGFQTHFLCHYVETPYGRDFIATREYFPDAFGASIRQKTRWVLGIVFQSKESLGWSGDLRKRYFLWRDRRAVWNGVLFLGSTLLLTTGLTSLLVNGRLPPVTKNEVFQNLCWLNLAQMGLRLSLRMNAVRKVYGSVESLFVPLRWPLCCVINTWAAFAAARRYRVARRKGEHLSWIKTVHRLPDGFGGKTAPKSGDAA